jgi:large subunit ribosomal protein L17
MASAIFLTEGEFTELDGNAPKVPGRIVTTLAKAKEIRPMVERCISIAKRSMVAATEAEKFATAAQRGTDEWKKWRESPQHAQWVNARAPVVAARRRVLQMLGDKSAMKICFDVVAPRFVDRPGGYTRVVRLSKPRLGDAGTRAILEFVGKNDRVRAKAQRPSFATSGSSTESSEG